jgi:hypothetical protein
METRYGTHLIATEKEVRTESVGIIMVNRQAERRYSTKWHNG